MDDPSVPGSTIRFAFRGRERLEDWTGGGNGENTTERERGIVRWVKDRIGTDVGVEGWREMEREAGKKEIRKAVWHERRSQRERETKMKKRGRDWYWEGQRELEREGCKQM